MAIPTEIQNLVPANAYVRKINNKWYVYNNVKWIYSQEKKRSVRTEPEKCIGKIELPYGFIRSDKKISNDKTSYVYDYGPYKFIDNLSQDILEQLKNFFETKDAVQIYVIAALRLICNNKTIELFGENYKNSFLFEKYPNLEMSGDTCSAFFKNLGFNQTKFEKFMKYILNKEDEQLAIDGTVISCASQKNDISYYGYNPHNLDQLQFKLLYVFNMKKNMPQYFEIIPGNVTDRSSLIPMVKQLNIANCTFVVDKGFSKSENYKEIVSNGNHFIIPAYKNSHLIKEQEELIFKFADVFAYSGKPIEYSLSVADKIGETEVWVYGFRDNSYENPAKINFLLNIANKNGETYSDYCKQREKFGVIVLVSDMKKDPKIIYETYMKRWDIEIMNDYFKNDILVGKSNMHSYESTFGKYAINHISLLMYYKIINFVKDNNLDINPLTILSNLSSIKLIKENDCYRESTTTINTKNLLILSENKKTST